MRRWGASLLAGAGLAGLSASADEIGWRPVGQPIAALPPHAVPTEPTREFLPVPQVHVGEPWQPGVGTDGPYSVPQEIAAEPVFRPATVPLDRPPMRPRTAQVVKADAQPAPAPSAPPETLAPPRQLPDSSSPYRPDAPPGPKPSAPQPTPVTVDPASRIWGGYGPLPTATGEVVLSSGESPPPIRHRAFGSEDVTISRDYHFLDFFGSYAGDEARAARQAAWAPDGSPATDRFLIQTEYLLWWVQPAKIPVLATTGTPESQGILNRPGTQLLLGPGSFGSTARNGFRVRGGWWWDEWLPGTGIDASYFFLGKQTSNVAFDSNQFPVITRPFFAPNFVPSAMLPGEFGERVASPGRSTGALAVDNTSELWGADVNLKCCVCRTCGYQSAWFGGMRFLGLDEGLVITEYIVSGQGNITPPGTFVIVQDSFAVRNRFYGPQVGYMVLRRFGRVTLDGRGSLALGVNVQELDIAGYQRVQPPGQLPQFFTGGLLAAGPNLGNFTNTAFSVVPEITVNLGYQLTPTFRAYVGYNFLFWSNVIRPGDQIDRVVDLSFVPNSEMNGRPIPPSGLLRPEAKFNYSDLWVQGIQFGAELRW